MVGHWVDKDDHVDVETDCNWTKNRTFITRSFTVYRRRRSRSVGHADRRLGSGCKAIRSWTFDSDGSFAEATWTHKRDRWFIRNEGHLADGRKASMTNVIKQIDAQLVHLANHRPHRRRRAAAECLGSARRAAMSRSGSMLSD